MAAAAFSAELWSQMAIKSNPAFRLVSMMFLGLISHSLQGERQV
jgi:hypothetical protein